MVIRKSHTRLIKEVIADFLKENKLEQGFQEQEMIKLWYQITGKMVASNTRSVDIRNRKMIVRLGSSVVRNELNMIRDGLLKELNSKFPKPVIDEIILR